MQVQTATLTYKKGNVYLCETSYSGIVTSLSETEIIDISVEAKAVKISNDKGESWEHIKEFHKTVRAHLGRYKTTGKWFWKKRTLTRHNKQ